MPVCNISTAVKTLRSTQINTSIGANAVIEVRSGPAPATPETTASGTLLATLTGNGTAFGTVSNGVLTANAIAQQNVTTSGTAGHVRIKTSGGTAVLDLDAGTSGTSVILNTTSLVAGGPVQVTSFTVTEA